MNIAVFASGRGSNFSAINRAVKRGNIPAEISLLVCDNPKAGVISKAKRAAVDVFLIRQKDFFNKREFENRIIQRLQDAEIDLIVLAGFMKMLSPEFIRAYKEKIMNIHPAILPSFKGMRGIEDAYNYGVKVAGVTVHFVDEEMDHGPIILQACIKVDENDTIESLEAKIHKLEHKLYPQAVKLFVEGRLKIEGRKVVIR